MVRAKLWLQCAAMFDPVSPVLVQPAVIGWEGKNRRIDLTIERPFKGEELLQRMKGWVTSDPREVIAAVQPDGFLKVYEQGELMVEADSQDQLERIQERLREKFGDRVYLEFAGS
ncbi:MAG: hypothetical protein HY892_02970 [Deltaproteobacteria bacterium]|nr:hypothetical protein [Deltaproteobacteria bacterium]